MVQWLTQFMPEWLAQFFLSIFAATVGVAMRLGHVAARSKAWVTWRQFILEVPTIFGMSIIAGPLGSWLNVAYNVDREVIYALCVVFGYLGANLINRFAAWLERRSDASKDE